MLPCSIEAYLVCCLMQLMDLHLCYTEDHILTTHGFVCNALHVMLRYEHG